MVTSLKIIIRDSEMENDKPYFSLAIDFEAKNKLNELTKLYKLTQSEVIEALLTIANSEVAVLSFEEKVKTKYLNREERISKKKKLRKALSSIPDTELLKILRDKGLL